MIVIEMLALACFALVAAIGVLLWSVSLWIRLDEDLCGIRVLSWREWWQRVLHRGWRL